jgi:peptide/nickel transport system substrate-binding protein
MDRETRRRLEAYRKQAAEVENTLIDEFAAGEMDRSEFIRRGTMFGLSLPLVGGIVGALGEAPLAFAKPRAARAGGRLRVAIIPPPSGALEPHLLADQGGAEATSIVGEFLNRANPNLTLSPELATSWKPNDDASVWTFKLRQGVKFQNGETMGADDVVATFKRLVDPGSGSQALSAFKGALSPDGVRKVDDRTVEFRLDAPTASFPYLPSSPTYQAIILPASYQLGTFAKTPQATGAFKLVSHTPGVGAKYDRYSGWWGGSAVLDGVDVTFYSDASATIAALLGGQVDLVGQVQFGTARPLFNNSNVHIFAVHGATHRQVPMRVDLRNPLRDWRVRQAIALTLDRPGIIKTLFNNLADIGNDTPFARVYPSTAPVPQRHKDLRKARQLMEAAGYRKGFSLKLTTQTTQEMPQLAQIIQSSVKAIEIKMSLEILSSTAYFAGSQTGPPAGWGSTPWLNTPINITDWGFRPVPNIYLTSALGTKGIWNAAHYSNKRFDRVAKSYIAAISIKDQRKYAKQLEAILLHDTPVIFPYFYDYIAAGSPRVKGYQADALGPVYLSKTSIA